MSEIRYDAFVIGSGQAGTPLALALARAGLQTALIERQHVGGTCVNEGCTPTKTMVASARVADLVRRAADYGVRSASPAVDMRMVRERKREMVESFRKSSQQRLEQTRGLDLIFGEARFTGPGRIEVRLNSGSVQSMAAAKIFINTGTRASLPPVEGITEVPALDNVSIMELETLPEHLLVLGGGYIGVEFSQMFRRFGSEVTMIQSRERLLAREDPDVADELGKILREDGIGVLLSAQTFRASQAGSRIQLRVRTSAGDRTLTGSHLLVATGRRPNTEALDLPAAGIATDSKGFIHTNGRLETTVENVWALGDVKGGPAFTHISYDDYRVIRKNLLENGNATTDGRLVPYTVFTDPQLGRVGLSEMEARAQGREIRVARLPMNSVARALETGESRGFMKAVVDARSAQILGAAVLGTEGGEIMAMLEVAMIGKLPYTALRDGIFAHPTLAESLNNLFMAMEGT